MAACPSDPQPPPEGLTSSSGSITSTCSGFSSDSVSPSHRNPLSFEGSPGSRESSLALSPEFPPATQENETPPSADRVLPPRPFLPNLPGFPSSHPGNESIAGGGIVDEGSSAQIRPAPLCRARLAELVVRRYPNTWAWARYLLHHEVVELDREFIFFEKCRHEAYHHMTLSQWREMNWSRGRTGSTEGRPLSPRNCEATDEEVVDNDAQIEHAGSEQDLDKETENAVAVERNQVQHPNEESTDRENDNQETQSPAEIGPQEPASRKRTKSLDSDGAISTRSTKSSRHGLGGKEK